MRLTAELIHKSPQYLNAIDDYHLNLRGNVVHEMCYFRLQNHFIGEYELDE